MVGGRFRSRGAATVALMVLLAESAIAQTPSPVTGTIGLTTGLSISDNPNLAPVSPGYSLTLSERLSFNLRTETRTQVLTLDARTDLSFDRAPGGGTSFNVTSPTVRASYSRTAANASLSANADFWQGEVTTLFDIDPTAAVLLVADDGIQTRFGSSVTVNLAQNAPLSFSASASQRVNLYSGTSDPNLFDNRTNTFTGSAGLRFSPVTQGTLTASQTQYTADDATSTNTVTTSLDLAVTHELRSALTVDANLGFQTRDLTTSGTTATNSGVRGGLTVTQDLPTGSISGGIGFDSTGPTNQASLTLGRQIDLPRATLSGSLTATNVSGSGLQFLGSGTYDMPTPDGNFSISLSQSLYTDQNNNDVLASQFGVSYDQQVNSTTDLNLDLNVARTQDGGAGSVPTQNRATFNASVNRQLTADWDMQVGYTRRLYSSAASPIRNSDTIFLNLSRNLVFGF